MRLPHTILMSTTVLVAVVDIGAVAVAQHKPSSPYAGQDARQIKSLSKNDVEQLLAGGGWGFAKPAELSGYPGPIHVLALADKLQLSKTQVRQIKDIYTAMNRRAKQLGTAFVASERSLSTAFVSATISSARLTTLLAESGRLRMKLREVHLAAHLAMKPLLTRHQVATYSQLRGYSQGGHQHRRH